MLQQRAVGKIRELPEIMIKTDTRDILSHATMQAEELEDYFLVDTRYRDAVLAGDHQPYRQRRDPPNGSSDDGEARHHHGATQRPAGHPLPERLRAHPPP